MNYKLEAQEALKIEKMQQEFATKWNINREYNAYINYLKMFVNNE